MGDICFHITPIPYKGVNILNIYRTSITQQQQKQISLLKNYQQNFFPLKKTYKWSTSIWKDAQCYNHYGNTNQNHNEYYFTSICITAIKKNRK